MVLLKIAVLDSLDDGTISIQTDGMSMENRDHILEVYFRGLVNMVSPR